MEQEMAQTPGHESQTLYFGEAWPSGVCEGGTQVPTPVGRECLWCDEGIVEGDRGVMTACMMLGDDKKSISTDVRPQHRECMMRSAMGSIGHLQKKCSCYGGDMEDPPGLTRREAAIQVWDWVMANGV